MDEYITFKFKKKQDKIILFCVINKENIPYQPELKQKIIKEYVDMLSKYEEKIYVCIDSRKLSYIDPRNLWEGASDMAKHNTFFAKKIKVVSVLISNKLILDTINMITKVTPFATPVKFFSKNDDAIKFIDDN